jgi:hypothetical protein
LCLAASFALVSCGRDSGTALDVRLVLTGSIDQIEVRSLVAGGTVVNLTDERTRFPEAPRMLVTGDVLRIWFPDSAGGKVVTISAAGLRCGEAVTDAATTAPRMLATSQTTSVDLTLAVTRSAGCDGGVDGPSGSGGSTGGQTGTAGRGGAGGTTGAGGTSGASGMAGASGMTGAGGTTGGTGGVVGTGGTAGTGGTGVAGAGGTAGTAGRGGTGGAGAAAGTAGGMGGRGGTGGSGTAGTGGTGVGGRGGTGGGTKPNGMPCGGGAECNSGNCVDSFCCDTPLANCAGCKACNLSASPGVCGNVPGGTDPHNACPANASNCAAGGCTAGACTPSLNTVVCSSVCSATNQHMTKTCNGVTVGCTNAATTSPCPGNLVCANATTCNTSCTTGGDAACLTGYFCAAGNCAAKLGNGQACTAANQCTSGACGSFHRDGDGDSYGAAATTTLCGSTPPTGYVTNGTDCCDADSDVKPGQTAWFAVGSTACAGTFDYNCSSASELQYGSGLGACTTTGACTVNNPTDCDTTTGWYGTTTAPGCGGTGTYLTSCNIAGSECTSMCADPGSCGRGCAAPVTVSRTQGCH